LYLVRMFHYLVNFTSFHVLFNRHYCSRAQRCTSQTQVRTMLHTSNIYCAVYFLFDAHKSNPTPRNKMALTLAAFTILTITRETQAASTTQSRSGFHWPKSQNSTSQQRPQPFHPKYVTTIPGVIKRDELETAKEANRDYDAFQKVMMYSGVFALISLFILVLALFVKMLRHRLVDRREQASQIGDVEAGDIGNAMRNADSSDMDKNTIKDTKNNVRQTRWSTSLWFTH